MKCCDRVSDLQGICLYFTLFILVDKTSCLLRLSRHFLQERTPSFSVSEIFLRTVFYGTSYWLCFIIGNRIRVRVIATSVFIELGMKNASLLCLFYLIKYSWGSESMCAFLYWSGAQLRARTAKHLPELSLWLLVSLLLKFPSFQKLAFLWGCSFWERILVFLAICTSKTCIEKLLFKIKVTS